MGIKPEGIDLIVLDFDGNITDAEKGAQDYTEGFKQDAADLIGIRGEEFEMIWNRAAARVDKNPELYEWVIKGKIVSTSKGNPNIIPEVITSILLDEHNTCTDLESRKNILRQVYLKNYKKIQTVFKKGVEKLLDTVIQLNDTVIISGSDGAEVEKRLHALNKKYSILPVYGDVKKQNITDDWDVVPETLNKKSYHRPIYLRRKEYGLLLEKIMQEKQVPASRMAVVGDVYELDLALPEYKGMHIALNARDSIAQCEIDAVNEYDKGVVVKTLEQVGEYLKKISKRTFDLFN